MGMAGIEVLRKSAISISSAFFYFSFFGISGAGEPAVEDFFERMLLVDSSVFSSFDSYGNLTTGLLEWP